jgi:hypothetical protein
MPYFGSQNPESFGWRLGKDAGVQAFSYDGHDFPAGVARGTVPLWTMALNRLVSAGGFRLPDDRGLDGGCWGFEHRKISGSNGWSFHAYGLALDVAAPWNPFSSSPPPPSPFRLPMNTGELLRPLGIAWGGDWSGRKDYMHIEIHASPDEVANLIAANGILVQPALPELGPPFPLPGRWYYGPYEGPAESVSGSGRDDAPYRPGLAAAQAVIGATADGYYGPQTRGAIEQWQAAHGLQVDGLLGVLTWVSLWA